MFLYLFAACNSDALKGDGIAAFGYMGEEIPTETVIADESDQKASSPEGLVLAMIMTDIFIHNSLFRFFG